MCTTYTEHMSAFGAIAGGEIPIVRWLVVSAVFVPTVCLANPRCILRWEI